LVGHNAILPAPDPWLTGPAWFYNAFMRASILLPLLLAVPGLCLAQTVQPTSTPTAAPQASAKADIAPVEKRTERIRVEDSANRIDELRVGGETKTITVQPKGGMPAYQVQPTSGERSWKLLGF
jgi:hypothetical protein